MILSDFHVHSQFSGDCDEKMRDVAQKAAEMGLETLCFTEHCDFDYPEPGFEPDMPAYRAEFERVRKKFSKKIKLLFGIELGVMDYLAPRLETFVRENSFDFVIASSHLVDKLDPYYPEYFEKFGEEGGVLAYFESILKNISAFSDFDVYGHLDYVVRYLPGKVYDPRLYADIIDEILKKLVLMGKGIELNTAGLRAGLSHANPHEFILKRYKQLGGETVTVGSDAHSSALAAADFDRAAEMLKRAGFGYYAVFEKRKAKFIEL